MRLALAILALATGLPATAAADLVTYEFSATAFEPHPQVPPFPGVEGGTSLAGVFSFETASQDSEADPGRGIYEQVPPARVELAFAGHTLVADVDQYTLFKLDDYSLLGTDPVDSFGWMARDAGLAQALGVPSVRTSLRLRTRDVSIFADDHLPTDLSPSDFETLTVSIAIELGDPSTPLDPTGVVGVGGGNLFRIDSLRRVPEPSATVLVGIALLAFAYVNR